jgi:putative ABC transport system permease protein
VNLRAVLAATRRELRHSTGRLLLVLFCLSIGVAAVVAVAGLARSFEEGLRGQSRELLGGDLRVSSFRDLPVGLEEAMGGMALARSDVCELPTMAGARGRSRLVRLKAVDGAFPLYGTVQTDPQGGLAPLLEDQTCVVAPDVLHDLGIAVGDQLFMGGVAFRVRGTVVRESEVSGISLVAGPRVFVSLAGLERAKLLALGSRIRRQALFQVPLGGRALADLKTRLRDRVEGGVYLDVETHEEAQPQARRAIWRISRYLSLVALLSLLLGGIGVAQIVRTQIAARMSATAVLRCLGFRPREVVAIHTLATLLLALAGSVAGGVVGMIAPFVLPEIAPDVFGAARARVLAVDAFGRGVLLGVATALLFAIPPLLAAGRVPPARVLRADAEPLPAPWVARLGLSLLIGLGLFVAAYALVRNLEASLLFAAGVIATALLLLGAARLVSALARRLPAGRLPVHLGQGLAALGRPSAGSTGALVALGLGVLAVLTLHLVETGLRDGLRSAVPEEAPTTFFLDIQPAQWEEVRTLIEARGGSRIESTPLVTARLSAMDGRSVTELLDGDGGGRRRWILTRELRMTSSVGLPPDNAILQGSLWSRPGLAEISVEKGFAEDLGATLGTRLTFDVHGVPVELTVTSIRTVEWQSFAINFFLVAEPGALDAAPQTRIATARLDRPAEREVQAALVASAPNVTVVPVRDALERVGGLLSRLAVGVQLLGSFAVLTGLVILGSAVATSMLRRRGELAVLKVCGVTRGGLALLLSIEYALVGLVAGLFGALGAHVAARAFLRHVLEIHPPARLFVVPLAALATALLAAAAGLLASRRALRVAPLETLRS